MKILVAVLFSLGSLTALAGGYDAHHRFEFFHGVSNYKYAKGDMGEVLVSLKIKKMDGGNKARFVYGFYKDDEVFRLKFTVVNRENVPMFDIKRRGKVIGYGYCFGNLCHLEYDMHGKHIEDTIYRKNKRNSLYSMGSASNNDGIIKSWKMHLKKIF